MKIKGTIVFAFLCVFAKAQETTVVDSLKIDSIKMGVPILECEGPKISSLYGMRFHPILKRVRLHNGVDISIRGGTDVRSVAKGIVVSTGFDDTGLGYFVKIAHGMGLESLYGHLYCYFVKVGDLVSYEEVIGLVGKSGMATGYHLHFIIKKEGVAIDPLPYFYSIITYRPNGFNVACDPDFLIK